MVSVGVKSAVIAYVATFVGVVADPLYLILEAVPAVDPLTVAACGEPLYTKGELVTDKVGVALFIIKFIR